jgi:ABC-2 type transport system permease protein
MGKWLRHPLGQLVLWRYYEFIREPEAIIWNFIFPIALAAGLGVAFREQAPTPLPVAATTPALVAALAREKGLTVELATVDQADARLRTGKVELVVAPSADQVTYRYDETNPEARTARVLADAAIQRAAGRRDPVVVREDVRRETGSRYIDFLVPGMAGLGLMNGAIWGLAFGITDARRRKLMKRIIATPMPQHYYLLSYLLWRLVLLPFEAGVPIGFGVLVFGVPLRGSLFTLLILCLLGSLAFSALGLLIACRARTIEAASGLTNLATTPMWIASGVFFSATRFPTFVQPLVKALPLTALNDALRANMLEGAGLAAVGPQLATLAVWLVVCFVLAMKLFRWR